MIPLFCKLTSCSGDPVYVNVSFIVYFCPWVFNDKPITSLFCLNDDEPIVVQESPEDILKQINLSKLHDRATIG